MEEIIEFLCSSKYYSEIILALLNGEEKTTYCIAVNDFKRGESASTFRESSLKLAEKTNFILTRIDEKDNNTLYVKLNYIKFIDLFFYIIKQNLKSQPSDEDKEIIINFFKTVPIEKILKNKQIVEKYYLISFLNHIFNTIYSFYLNIFLMKQIVNKIGPILQKNIPPHKQKRILDEISKPYVTAGFYVPSREESMELFNTCKRLFGDMDSILSKLS